MPKKPPAPFKAPETLGECADMLYETKNTRLVDQRGVKDLEQVEKALKAHILAVLPDTETGVIGQKAKVMIEERMQPIISDWGSLCAWVAEQGRFDIFQRRLSEAVVEALWEDGVLVPGVDQMLVHSFSVTKR